METKHGTEVLNFCSRQAQSQQSAQTARRRSLSPLFREQVQLRNCFSLGARPAEYHSPLLNKCHCRTRIMGTGVWPGWGVVMHIGTCLV